MEILGLFRFPVAIIVTTPILNFAEEKHPKFYVLSATKTQLIV